MSTTLQSRWRTLVVVLALLQAALPAAASRASLPEREPLELASDLAESLAEISIDMASIAAEPELVQAKNRVWGFGFRWWAQPQRFQLFRPRIVVGFAEARFYDPLTGRFLSNDPAQGDPLQPPSLHRYLYSFGNPTTYIDLNGREGVQVQVLDFEFRIPSVEELVRGSSALSFLAGASERPLQGIEQVRQEMESTSIVPPMMRSFWERTWELEAEAMRPLVGLQSGGVEGFFQERRRTINDFGGMLVDDLKELPGVRTGVAISRVPGEFEKGGKSGAARQIGRATGLLAEDILLLEGARAGLRSGAPVRVVENPSSLEAAGVPARPSPGPPAVGESSLPSANRAAIPGDAGFIGPHRKSWTLAPEGQGAHLVERANVRGRDALASLDQAETPRFYPEGTPENAGAAHIRIHQATRRAGIKLKGGNPGMPDAELLQRYRKAYNDPELAGVRGDLRTPDSSLVVGRDLTPAEAIQRLLKEEQLDGN